MISKEDLNRLAQLVCARGYEIRIEYTGGGYREFQALESDPDFRLDVVVEGLDLETFIKECQERRPISIDTEITDEMERKLFYLAKQLEEKDDPPALCVMISERGLNYIDLPCNDYDTSSPYSDFERFISYIAYEYEVKEDDNDK
jgi:hypothetical protein